MIHVSYPDMGIYSNIKVEAGSGWNMLALLVRGCYVAMVPNGIGACWSYPLFLSPWFGFGVGLCLLPLPLAVSTHDTTRPASSGSRAWGQVRCRFRVEPRRGGFVVPSSAGLRMCE